MNPISKKTCTRNTSRRTSGDNWTGYTLNLFRKHFEKCYTTDLEQYKFDKTECKACVHNAANYNLFAEHNGCGHCTNRKCLETKNAAFVAKETEKLLKSDPKLVIARPITEAVTIRHSKNWTRKGMKSRNSIITYRQGNFPKYPKHRKRSSSPNRQNMNKRYRPLNRKTRNTPKKWKNLTVERKRAG